MEFHLGERGELHQNKPCNRYQCSEYYSLNIKLVIDSNMTYRSNFQKE